MNGQLDAAQTVNGQLDAAQTVNGQLDAAQTVNGQIDAAQTVNGQLDTAQTVNQVRRIMQMLLQVAFCRCVHKIAKQRAISFVRPSVHARGTTWLPLERFS
jgi:hypothetical protein